ncbi:MAG: VOC family protein [Thermoanaerobaculia bacterium]
MTEVKRHDPGSFSWAELATPDPAAAKKFYTSLFGWGVADTSMGPGPEDVYTRLQIGGKDVGALYKMVAEQRSQGVPPNWLPYVTVSSADDTAKKAKELEATVLAEPFDVMTYGRMAVLQDPTGSTIAIWEARQHIGAQHVNEPGAFCWMELLTGDIAKAGKFYAGLFGWTVEGSAFDSSYTEFWRGETPIGGMMPIRPEWGSVPPHWTVYWQVTDVDESATKARSLGAKVLVEPQDIPTVGRFATLQDPQGAAFSLFKPTGS